MKEESIYNDFHNSVCQKGKDKAAGTKNKIKYKLKKLIER